MRTSGAVGACLDLKDVHAVAHCRAGSVSELCMDWEAALGVLQGLHESVRARVPCRATASVLVVHFVRPLCGQISGVLLT